VLSSLLALVALMCFPLLAQANDSSGVVYETGLPNAGGHHSGHGPIAKSSTHSGGTSSGEPSQESSAPSEVSSGGSSSEKGEGGSNNGPQRHQGSPAHAKGGSGNPAAKSPAHVSPAAPADEGSGSSSPLVPILIAIAALAAISIGVVLVRQRRQRPPGHGDLSTRTG
jgi:hypothetical protein